MSITKLLLIYLTLFAISFLVYFQLFFTFYQQDEWGTLGYVMTEGLGGFLSDHSIAGLISGGGRPLAIPIQFAFYKFFPFQIEPFALFAIFFHSLNSLMLFILSRKISKNNFIAVVSSIFFVTSSAGQQAVSWAAASTTTLPSAFFVFLSIYLYINFLEKNKKRFFYFSFISGIIAYLFKESAFILFIFLPFLYVFLRKEKANIVTVVKKHWQYLALTFYIVVIRIVDLLITPKEQAFFLTHNSLTWQSIVLRSIFYPIESLSQIFIPGVANFSFANYFVSILYPRLSDMPIREVVAETIATDMISIFLSAVIILIMIFIYSKKNEVREIILFGLPFALISFIPYVVVAKANAYLDSRYIYLGVAGGAIVFGVFFDYVRSLLREKLRFSIRYATIIVGVIVLPYFFYQISNINQNLKMQVEYAQERKNFLTSITKMYSRLSDKAIVYISGDNDFYVANNKVPFQQGIGYTLMVWYYHTGNIPKEFINENFLWELTSQGYKEIGNHGFGYFWDLNKLKKEIIEKKLNTDSIVAVHYDSKNKKIQNTTSAIRKEVSVKY